MTAPIGSLGPAIAALRAAMASGVQVQNTQGSRQSGIAAVKLPTDTPRRQVAGLAKRLSRLSGDLETRRRNALRLFVEAVLCDEFGESLQQDPELLVLVERVSAAIEAAPDAHDLLHAAIDPLLSSSTGV
jgi:hypothetical protein